jgi:hypothetical protein
MARTCRGWWLLAMFVGVFPVPVMGQGGGSDLQAVAARLKLTASGARRWLDALGVTPGQVAPERLLAVSVTGEVLLTQHGGESSVALGLELDLRLLDGANAIVLVHNHPGSASLSANDLAQLAKPGVAAVVAVGHDGSIYLALRGPRYDVAGFEPRQYEVARREIRRRLLIERSAGAVSLVGADAHFSHLAALALATAGIIEYRAVLATDSRASFELSRVAFGHVAAGAAGALGGR